MNTHALIAEETGYRDSRLLKPIASPNPHYLRGYRQGEGDRFIFDKLWETYLFLKTSETIQNQFRNCFRNDSESTTLFQNPYEHNQETG